MIHDKKIKVGILGGGQLASMLIEASSKMPVEISLFCENDDEATRGFPNRCIASTTDTQKLSAWAAEQDVITFEHEHVNLAGLALAGINTTLAPSAKSVSIAQDRELEKKTFEKLSIPIAPWQLLPESTEHADQVPDSLFPAIVKTATHGYDGKGQFSVNNRAELLVAIDKFAKHHCVIEKRISFTHEVSQVSVRNKHGEILHYPLVDNIHRAGILSRTRAPAAQQILKASEYTERLAKHLNYVGVLAVEFFVVNGQLVANEWAPRVHNSGHWTIEGALTSQFENHLRAITGMQLGACTSKSQSITTMWNLIGVSEEKVRLALADLAGSERLHLHWYGKSPRIGRKVGHITLVAAPVPTLDSTQDDPTMLAVESIISSLQCLA